MKKVVVMQWIAVVALCSLLAVGCAKKPAAQQAPAEAPVETKVAVEQPTAVADQGVSESSVKEQVPADIEAVARQLQRIHFDFDQFSLSAQARDILAANAALLQANPGVKVRIEGHCDERGSDEYNLALGERRAIAARDYLVSLGVAADRISTISYGEEMPLDPASNEAAWAKNRRDEFKAVR
ncbi:peptidoglycan-associated lipoprotein Pal [Geothermobacter hydrogeniphilus]|uniref:Peptidoglycan-associated lipoprotein n=1 Tax=Geothermobacter hydrogeniphilus TaxID=1969733 RepID=A0A1X0XSK5_9BACT|nr:peptidoglycan-associated lipoprotein Pal [Geothermobacter hydrogeniphilus]ORJ55837.1 peptidoglycan-associated lipoprotein [Geothermobacter hydrogeniphilus]